MVLFKQSRQLNKCSEMEANILYLTEGDSVAVHVLCDNMLTACSVLSATNVFGCYENIFFSVAGETKFVMHYNSIHSYLYIQQDRRAVKLICITSRCYNHPTNENTTWKRLH